jgi:hypothetical protein
MSELPKMLTGWLGYLERPSTLIQLAILIAAALISGQLARRHPRALALRQGTFPPPAFRPGAWRSRGHPAPV